MTVLLALVSAAVVGAPPAETSDAPVVHWDESGLSIRSADDRFAVQFGARLQFRYTYEHLASGAPQDFSSFRVRRARLKVEGHGYEPWLKYEFEYDWPSNSLLDWVIAVERFSWLRLRAGQWKVDFNRERIDSSGKLQLVERSIVDAPFTLDRQIGVQVDGRLFQDTPAFLHYYFGIFTGTGINQPSNDDPHMLYQGRIQWNFLGRDVPFFQGDPGFTSKPNAALAVTAAHNRSNRVEFPQTENLGQPGQFVLQQLGEDFVFRYRGISFQQEFQFKRIIDRISGEVTDALGGYVQGGILPHGLWPRFPREFEIAARYALVDPDIRGSDDLQREISVGANWYFQGHRSKLTADVRYVTDSAATNDLQLQTQLDISF